MSKKMALILSIILFIILVVLIVCESMWPTGGSELFENLFG